MKTVTIAELKNRLSYGVSSAGSPSWSAIPDRAIARIDRVEPGPGASGHEAEWLHRLERRGIIRRGSGKRVAGRSHLGRDLVAALLEEREEGP